MESTAVARHGWSRCLPWPDVADTPWTFEGSIASLGGPGELITLVEETTFCLCARNGDLVPGGPQGLVLLDTRFLSGLVVRVDRRPLESLGVSITEPFDATFYTRVAPRNGEPDVPLVVLRSRQVGRGLVERIRVEHHGLEPVEVQLTADLQADFADLFEVKEQRPVRSRVHRVEVDGGRLHVVGERDGDERRTTLTTDPPAEIRLRAGAAVATWSLRLESQTAVSVHLEVCCGVGGSEVEPRFRCGLERAGSEPARRLGTWRAAAPRLETDDERLAAAVARGVEDLGALHLVDPDHPGDRVVAAGAPWFMTLFGRDALLASYMALIVDPGLALGVLRTLARLQGRTVDASTEEEPGRIIHELRFDRRPSWRFADATRYSGSVDATPLFVVLLGELRRWGIPAAQLDELRPAADAALEWMSTHGDPDRDGYVEYRPSTAGGLTNQGWKDSWDAVRHRDGTLAEGPIALCEVQAYAYAALLARAYFAEEAGDTARCTELRSRAAALRAAFQRDFWVDDDEGGYVALALDGAGRPVEAVTSNMGHCLWTGILDPDRAAQVADRLLAPDMFSGWGIRTLSSRAAAYNPVSYHNGSVWPHDNALIVAGLVRYGLVSHAHRVIDALLDASTHHGGRLPELMAGTDRATVSVPVAYPTSCIPQAWAAATPLLLLRSLLRLDPWMAHGQVWLSPAPLPGRGRVRVEGIRLGSMRVSVDDTGAVDGLDPSVTVHREPRPPITRALGGR